MIDLAHALVGANVALNATASIAYAATGRWNEAIYWAAAVVLTSAVLWRSLQ